MFVTVTCWKCIMVKVSRNFSQFSLARSAALSSKPIFTVLSVPYWHFRGLHKMCCSQGCTCTKINCTHYKGANSILVESIGVGFSFVSLQFYFEIVSVKCTHVCFSVMPTYLSNNRYAPDNLFLYVKPLNCAKIKIPWASFRRRCRGGNQFINLQ